jgi:hypothetical protein
MPLNNETGHEEKPPVAWSAASSSIPQIRTVRHRPVLVEQAAIEAWEDPEDDTLSARSSAASASRMDAAPRAGRSNPYPLEREFAALMVWARRQPRILWIGTGVALVIAIVATMLTLPREHFVPVTIICADARAMDGQLVHVHGIVGQTFKVGGGSAFYLHEGRDSLVVYTLLRSPVEREHIKLFGTVSTGFLDGKPRVAVFEAASPGKN